MPPGIPLSAITPDKLYSGGMPSPEEFLNGATVSQIPVVSDVASGGMAVLDALRGNYGSAALNAIGILPGIPAMGGMTRMSSKWLKPQTAEELAQNYANRFVHPVHTSEGSRFSGFTDPINQTTLHGYNKNGAAFTQRASTVDPSTLDWSRDSNKTLNAMLDALRSKEK